MTPKIELIQGDCLEKMKDIPDGSVDCVITDPPYGITECKWDTCIPFESMWEQLKRVTKKNGAIVLFGSQPFTSALVMSNPRMFKYEWVWDKISPTGHLNAKKRPMKKLENILVFSQSTPVYYPQGLVWNPRKRSRKTTTLGSTCYGKHGANNTSTWQGYPTERIEIKGEYGLHPTQKPVSLMEYLIKTYTTEGETVLDFTMGSFTTAIACLNTQRNFIGIELDEHYFEVGTKRVECHLKTLGE